MSFVLIPTKTKCAFSFKLLGMMFRFSLQTALDVRSRQEKIKMKELAEKLTIEREIQQRIEDVNVSLLQADDNLNAMKQSGGVMIEQMKFLSHFKARMKVVQAKNHVQLTSIKAEVSKKQQALIEASRAKKTLEILRDKEEKRFLEKITSIERKSMDEIAGNLCTESTQATGVNLGGVTF